MCGPACVTDGDCTPSDLGPCCNARCEAGECILFSDDDLCAPGACFQCNGNTGMCEFQCDAGEVCCNDECVTGDCCATGDCTARNECFRAACTDHDCVYSPANDLCTEACEVCDVNGACEDDCGSGEICCDDNCLTGDCCDVSDCTDTGECLVPGCVANLCIYMTDNSLCDPCETCQPTGACDSDCESDEICCDDSCVEGVCCIDDDCDPVSCARVSCTNNTCGAVSLCPPQGDADIRCCAFEGQPELDYCYNLDEGACCFDEECEAVTVSEGTCLTGGCFDGICGFVRDNERCDKDECCCENGACSHDCCEDCREFGEECGLIVNGTFIASDSPQLDCCDGLVCCEVGNDHVCAECCGDWECPKGSICCAGVCREIECCIDDILTGGDPNARCPEGCGCFEGLCVDDDQRRCRHCTLDKDCPDGDCCCRNGICSHHCCDDFCKHDKDCGHGKCCCHDGTCSEKCCGGLGCKSDHDCAKDTCCCKHGGCSHDCCNKPDDDTPQIDFLPNTGTGSGEDATSWIAGAALLGGAAALLGSKIKQGTTPAEEPEG